MSGPRPRRVVPPALTTVGRCTVGEVRDGRRDGAQLDRVLIVPPSPFLSVSEYLLSLSHRLSLSRGGRWRQSLVTVILGPLSGTGGRCGLRSHT